MSGNDLRIHEIRKRIDAAKTAVGLGFMPLGVSKLIEDVEWLINERPQLPRFGRGEKVTVEGAGPKVYTVIGGGTPDCYMLAGFHTLVHESALRRAEPKEEG